MANLTRTKETSLKYNGQITEWDDERGLGFIAPDGDGTRVFAHVSQSKASGVRPILGDRVSCSLGKDDRGRLRARAIGYTDREIEVGRKYAALPRTAIGFGALAVVEIALLAGILPPLIAGVYFLLTGASFLMYLKDKRAAKKNAWRTPEQTLHLLDLLGGWPGGLIAQQQCHHKTAKQSFQFVFWVSVVANLAGVWWLVTTGKVEQLTQLARSVIG